MLLKKILSILLPCFIAMASVMVTNGYVYADKRFDKEYNSVKETKKSAKKRSSDSHPKRDRDTRKADKKRSRPQHYTQPERRDYYRRPSRPDYSYRYENRDRRYRPPARHYNTRPRAEYYYRKGKRYKRVIVIPSRRYHDQYIYIRPFRHSYPHYRPLYYDNHLWGWLAFTLITLQILDHLNDDQRHAHEQALYRATRSPLGEPVIWSDNADVIGSVTPVWEGQSNSGQYCREYRHEISVGDRTEIAYGTACLRPDGSWEIVQ